MIPFFGDPYSQFLCSPPWRATFRPCRSFYRLPFGVRSRPLLRAGFRAIWPDVSAGSLRFPSSLPCRRRSESSEAFSPAAAVELLLCCCSVSISIVLSILSDGPPVHARFLLIGGFPHWIPVSVSVSVCCCCRMHIASPRRHVRVRLPRVRAPPQASNVDPVGACSCSCSCSSARSPSERAGR